MNRELGADFDLSGSGTTGESRVEMPSLSRAEQLVTIPAAGVAAASGRLHGGVLVHVLGAAGFVETRSWTDDAARYALVLFEAA